jgi:DDE superfamily endonuclease
LQAFVASLRQQSSSCPVELWCEDEARLGLKPLARRVWALRGQRPSSSGRQRYQSLYVYGFARPATGQNRCWLLPKAKAALLGEALADFARWADPQSQKVLVLLVDRASWHTTGKLAVPNNVRLFHLPSCTPELQPAEPLWPLLRESLANRDFDHMVALGAKVHRRCHWLAEHPDIVQGEVGFHWAVNL